MRAAIRRAIQNAPRFDRLVDLHMAEYPHLLAGLSAEQIRDVGTEANMLAGALTRPKTSEWKEAIRLAADKIRIEALNE